MQEDTKQRRAADYSPDDLTEGLGIAIAYHTLDQAILSSNQIWLYNLYSLEDNSFLGSFYGIKQNDLYYGSIVGRTESFSCPKNAFRFEETDKLPVPLKHDKGSLYVLMCRHDRKTDGLTASYLKRTDQNNGSETLLHKFDNKISFAEASITARVLFTKNPTGIRNFADTCFFIYPELPSNY